MTTFLIALRFAANLETTLIDLQRRRFYESGDTSTRFLPPIVPLTICRSFPNEGLLDRIRKRSPLILRRTQPPYASAGDHPKPIGAAYPLTIDGYLNLRSEIDNIPKDTSTERSVWPGDISIERDRPILRLGWSERPVETVVPCPIPETRAVWLCVFRLSLPHGAARWWGDSRWEMLYSRRTTNWESKPNTA